MNWDAIGQRGVLSNEVFAGCEALLERQLALPVFREWWSFEQGSFDPDFRRLVEKILERL